MFTDLIDHPGVDEVVHLRSSFGFMAFHGGSLEQETDVVAAAAAEAAGASLYAVIQPADLWWHIPSNQVAGSPALADFLDHVEVVVSVHGFGRDGLFTSLLLGGRNRELAAHLGGHLEPGLPEYDVVADLDRIPAPLRGIHPRNPVNRARSGGVQLELPPRVRGMGPFWADRDISNGCPHTEALIAALAAAATAWPPT